MLALAGLAGCTGGQAPGAPSPSPTPAKKITFLLPQGAGTRYDTIDRPVFESTVRALCADCSVESVSADSNAPRQAQQAQTALDQGASVLVLAPVDPVAAVAIVNAAQGRSVPVVAYDEFVAGDVRYFVGYDGEQVAATAASALVDVLRRAGKVKGNLVMINGPRDERDAVLYKQGAHRVLDRSGFTVVAEHDTKGWSADRAKSWMDDALTKIKDVAGIYTADDRLAEGAITSVKSTGLRPLPPTTGQGAQAAGIQRVIGGDQSLTVYRRPRPLALRAAAVAVALARHEPVPEDTTRFGVRATLLPPVVVTRSNVKSTILADRLYSTQELCAGAYAPVCRRLRLL